LPRDQAASRIQLLPAGSFLVIRMLEGSRTLPELCLLRKASGAGTSIEDFLVLKRDNQYVVSVNGREVRANFLDSLIRTLRPQLDFTLNEEAVR